MRHPPVPPHVLTALRLGERPQLAPATVANAVASVAVAGVAVADIYTQDGNAYYRAVLRFAPHPDGGDLSNLGGWLTPGRAAARAVIAMLGPTIADPLRLVDLWSAEKTP